MRLLIISHTEHYLRNGVTVGWGSTIREIDHLASLFQEVRHIAPLHREPAPASAIPYSSRRVIHVPVAPAGGESFVNKLGILTRLPGYTGAILREMKGAGVVHVRCPANISLLAMLLLSVAPRPRKRWMKYAGNWRPDRREPWSYRFQRWWLENGWQRGVVTINGDWPGQPGHVRSFLNPCLTEEELTAARAAAAGKQMSEPVRLLLVGRLEEAKGVGRALRVLGRLSQLGVTARLDLVGDGPDRKAFESLAAALGVREVVNFRGWLPRSALAPLYSQSHLMLYPTSTEGWPKILSEGMAHGVVPLATAVSCIPQILDRFRAGRAFHREDVDGFASAVAWYCENPSRWKEESQNGVNAAEFFTYKRYLHSVQNLLELCNLDGGFTMLPSSAADY